jgi:uncharacterized protein YjaG (DUF416 family)
MNYMISPSSIYSHLETFDGAKRLAFGIFLLERSLPEFYQFQIDSGCSGGAELRAALAQCWSALENDSLQGEEFTSADACEKFLPDSEEHTSTYTSAAIDAVDITCTLLTYLEKGDLDLLMDAIESRLNTLDLFIQNNTDLVSSEHGFEKKIVHHYLMQEELRFLHEDIALLQGIPNERPAVFAAAIQRISQFDYRPLHLRVL